MAEAVYVLCALTSLVCAILLIRAYRSGRSPLLLWSSICFVGLFSNDDLLVFDKVLTNDDIDLLLARDVSTVASVAALLFGLIWRSK